MSGLFDSLQTEYKRNVSYHFYKWLSEPDDPPPFRFGLYSAELGFEISCIPFNLAIAWCLLRTQTFHLNLRLIMLNDILSGVIEMAARAVLVANVLFQNTVISLENKEFIQYYRGLFIYQVQYCFLNILLERLIAVNFPHKYEKAPISVGVVILVWIFMAFLLYIISAAVSVVIGVFVNLFALLMTRYWLKTQRSYPTSTATLSTRYQIAENVKTLLMCRHWVYFYVGMSLLEKSFLVSAYLNFLYGEKENWRLSSNFYDLSHAFYMLVYPAFLVYGSPNLRRQLGLLLGRRGRVVRTNKLVNQDDFGSHFRRLQDSWEAATR